MKEIASSWVYFFAISIQFSSSERNVVIFNLPISLSLEKYVEWGPSIKTHFYLILQSALEEVEGKKRKKWKTKKKVIRLDPLQNQTWAFCCCTHNLARPKSFASSKMEESDNEGETGWTKKFLITGVSAWVAEISWYVLSPFWSQKL